jgi:hypothetical protein
MSPQIFPHMHNWVRTVLQFVALPGKANVLVHEPSRSIGINFAEHLNIKDNIRTCWYVQAASWCAYLLVAICQGTRNVQVGTRFLAHPQSADGYPFNGINSGLHLKDGIALWPSIVFSSVEGGREGGKEGEERTIAIGVRSDEMIHVHACYGIIRSEVAMRWFGPAAIIAR